MKTLLLVSIGIGIGVSACGAGYGNSGYGAPSSEAMAPGPGTLTVKNFLNWCSVKIDGGAASTSATVTASVSGGNMATIVATPASGSFEIGPNPWFGVDQNNGAAAPGVDVGSGTNETSTAVVTINQGGTPQCVSVCCQEPGNGPIPCPATDPCRQDGALRSNPSYYE
jgi:hypothetical protein